LELRESRRFNAAAAGRPGVAPVLS